MNNWRQTIVDKSKKKLEEAVDENDFKSIKFVLENLDANFSLSSKELLNNVYADLSIQISEAQFLDKKSKELCLKLIKNIFDNVQ